MSDSDNDRSPLNNWSYVGTFDNGATTTQLRFLAKVAAASASETAAPFRTAFLRGIDYALAAQYPNGGWPQVWPLQGGYHDAVTYNDNAMIRAITLLQDVARGTNEFAFVPQRTRELAAASAQRGLKCILATQINVQGKLTVWCQQHDVFTLQPTAARNYEMPAQTTGESAEILKFLMQQSPTTTEITNAVHAAAAWFEKTRLPPSTNETTLVERAGADADAAAGRWARFYQIGTDKPIFGDRDKTIHDDVNEISKERRSGYAWFTESPASALKRYASWRRSQEKQQKAR